MTWPPAYSVGLVDAIGPWVAASSAITRQLMDHKVTSREIRGTNGELVRVVYPLLETLVVAAWLLGFASDAFPAVREALVTAARLPLPSRTALVSALLLCDDEEAAVEILRPMFWPA